MLTTEEISFVKCLEYFQIFGIYNLIQLSETSVVTISDDFYPNEECVMFCLGKTNKMIRKFVVIDKDENIIFDPFPEYGDVITSEFYILCAKSR